jgi:hypothetical protein
MTGVGLSARGRGMRGDILNGGERHRARRGGLIA